MMTSTRHRTRYPRTSARRAQLAGGYHGKHRARHALAQVRANSTLSVVEWQKHTVGNPTPELVSASAGDTQDKTAGARIPQWGMLGRMDAKGISEGNQ